MFEEFWDKLTTDVEDIDTQHASLFKAVQRFEHKNKTKEDLWNILLEIERYACVHFETEEKYMSKFSYPDIETHIKEHQDFLNKFNELKCFFDVTGFSEEFVTDFQKFILEWLTSHYTDADIKMAEFTKQRLKQIKSQE